MSALYLTGERFKDEAVWGICYKCEGVIPSRSYCDRYIFSYGDCPVHKRLDESGFPL